MIDWWVRRDRTGKHSCPTLHSANKQIPIKKTAINLKTDVSYPAYEPFVKTFILNQYNVWVECNTRDIVDRAQRLIYT